MMSIEKWNKIRIQETLSPIRMGVVPVGGLAVSTQIFLKVYTALKIFIVISKQSLIFLSASGDPPT